MYKKATLSLIFAILVLIPIAGLAGTADYDTLSIYDVQFVTDPLVNELSPYNGDTVVVKGIVSHGPRLLWVGARWACYVSDGTDNPWAGFFVIQHDSTAVNTLLGFVQPGDECYFTGVVDEYTGLTQLALLTDPVTPITIVSAGNPVPAPKVLTFADLATPDMGEQWESMLVRVENAVVTNNNVSSNQASLTDGSGATGYIDDYFWYFRNQFNNGANPWPANGTNVNVVGYTRDVAEPFHTINPAVDAHIEILTNPPVISGLQRSPGVPMSLNAVNVVADIVDNGTVASAKVHYSVNWGAFMELPMTNTLFNSYSATIPAQANNAYVRYFLTAEDNVGDKSQVPGDTSSFVYSYVVRDNGLSIKDVQYTWGYPEDDSPFRTYATTLEGVVMTDTSDFVGNYWIASKDSAWYGIWVNDGVNKPAKGDLVSVTGTVQEAFGVTRIESVTNFSIVTPGVGAFAPVTVTTGEIGTGGANAEAYESVYVSMPNVTVSNPYPDGTSNYGEFAVDDGTGELRVDDNVSNSQRSAFSGNYDSTYVLNSTIQELRGLHYYSYSNYKLLPRDTSDIIGHVVGIESDPAILSDMFELQQNYPNPFNPTTTIVFEAPRAAGLTLNVYNVLGQRVKTLFKGNVMPGRYTLQWDGKSDAGAQMGSGIYFYQLSGQNISMTKKMFLMK